MHQLSTQPAAARPNTTHASRVPDHTTADTAADATTDILPDVTKGVAKGIPDGVTSRRISSLGSRLGSYLGSYLWRRLLPAFAGLIVWHAGAANAQTPAGQDPIWDTLAKTHYIATGKPSAKQIVYVIMDPNCPYCSRLYHDLQPWITSGKVQVRDILVGILRPSSPGKAAALLSAKDPTQALAGQEAMLNAFNANNTSGRLHPNEAGGVAPLNPIPAALQADLQENQQVMASLNVDAVPVLIWRDRSSSAGTVRMSVGASAGELPAALGPVR